MPPHTGGASGKVGLWGAQQFASVMVLKTWAAHNGYAELSRSACLSLHLLVGSLTHALSLSLSLLTSHQHSDGRLPFLASALNWSAKADRLRDPFAGLGECIEDIRGLAHLRLSSSEIGIHGSGIFDVFKKPRFWSSSMVLGLLGQQKFVVRAIAASQSFKDTQRQSPSCGVAISLQP